MRLPALRRYARNPYAVGYSADGSIQSILNFPPILTVLTILTNYMYSVSPPVCFALLSHCFASAVLRPLLSAEDTEGKLTPSSPSRPLLTVPLVPNAILPSHPHSTIPMKILYQGRTRRRGNPILPPVPL
jgi:hypothetical protein